MFDYLWSANTDIVGLHSSAEARTGAVGCRGVLSLYVRENKMCCFFDTLLINNQYIFIYSQYATSAARAISAKNAPDVDEDAELAATVSAGSRSFFFFFLN